MSAARCLSWHLRPISVRRRKKEMEGVKYLSNVEYLEEGVIATTPAGFEVIMTHVPSHDRII